MQELLNFITSGVGNYLAVLLFAVLILFTVAMFIGAIIDRIVSGCIAIIFAWRYQTPPPKEEGDTE
jgi:hypothetical protein